MKVVIQNDRSVARTISLTDKFKDGWAHLVHIINGMLHGETSAVIDVDDTELAGLSSGEAYRVKDNRITPNTVILSDSKADVSNFTITTGDGEIVFTRS